MGTRIDRLQFQARHPGAFVAMLGAWALGLLAGCLLVVGVAARIAPTFTGPATDWTTCDLDQPSQACTDVLDLPPLPTTEAITRARAYDRLWRGATNGALDRDALLAGGVRLPMFGNHGLTDRLMLIDGAMANPNTLPGTDVLADLLAAISGGAESTIRADLERQYAVFLEAERLAEQERRRNVLERGWERVTVSERGALARAERQAELAHLPLLAALPCLVFSLAAWLLARRWRSIPVIVTSRTLQVGAARHPLYGATAGMGEVLLFTAAGDEVELPWGHRLSPAARQALDEALNQSIRGCASSEDRLAALQRLQHLRAGG